MLQPDVAVALRGALALATAWTLCLVLHQPAAGMVAAMTAQNVSFVRVRGDYWARFAVLAVLMATMAFWIYAGSSAHGMVSAVALTGLLAVSAGAWRHASADFGPQFALASALMFFLGLSHPASASQGTHLAAAAGLGGAVGVVFQVSGWLFRPEHALRHSVAEGWVAVADLLHLFATNKETLPEVGRQMVEQEFQVRTTLDKNFRALREASRGKKELITHLEGLLQLAARFWTRITALHSSLEEEDARDPALRPALETLWRALEDVARSAALTTLHHRADHFAAFELRVRNAEDLLKVLVDRVSATPEGADRWLGTRTVVLQLRTVLEQMKEGMQGTIDRGSIRSFAVPRLPDLGRRSLGALSAWINPVGQIDPAIVRYTLRIAVLMMGSIAAYVYFEIPRGYWIAFTVLVVLQPDFGATRLRAGQRILGTVAGSIVGSGLLWVRLPTPWLIVCCAVLSFFFGYFVRRRYSVGVFFVTLMVVLMMESIMTLHLDFTIARTVASMIGGGLALAAAMFFWPAWREENSAHVLGNAIQANRKYLEAVGASLMAGAPFAGPAVEAKREAERANSKAAASLQRLMAQPSRVRVPTEKLEALTAHNQRLTRAITLLGQELHDRERGPKPEFETIIAALAEDIDGIAKTVEAGSAGAASRARRKPLAASEARSSVYDRLARLATEVDAMRAAAERE